MEEDIILIGSDKFPCPSCGGAMKFSPSAQSLLCSYCGNDVNIDKLDDGIKEYSFDAAEATLNHNWGSENRIISCKSCSGETIIDISVVSANCVFCGSSHVVDLDINEGIKPESIIPFKISKDHAKKNISSWLKVKFYAPSELKKQQKLDRLNSLYLPFFTYDSNTSTAYIGQKGTHYYVTRTKRVNGKTQTTRERRTRWSRVSGVYANYFNDVLVNTSSKVEDELIDRMNSFNLDELVKYNPAFLAGHYAERYSISLNEAWLKGKMEIDSLINSGIRSQVGGDEFRLSSKSTNYGDILFKHILLPVWVTSYKYKKSVYNVYVNGQTGNVIGKYPKDIFKIALTFLVIGIVIFMIYYFFIR